MGKYCSDAAHQTEAGKPYCGGGAKVRQRANQTEKNNRKLITALIAAGSILIAGAGILALSF